MTSCDVQESLLQPGTSGMSMLHDASEPTVTATEAQIVMKKSADIVLNYNYVIQQNAVRCC